MKNQIDLSRFERVIKRASVIREQGRVVELSGLAITGYMPGVSVGAVCELKSFDAEEGTLAEVVGFKGAHIVMMPLDEGRGLGLNARIRRNRTTASVKIGEGLLGRVINGKLEPLDDQGPLLTSTEWPLYGRPINPLKREKIREPVDLGVRAINGLLTLGRGQRVGIMAGSGVGKSVLLGMLAQQSDADINVIALIGERGREVREFIENELGPEALKRSVVIAVTSDESPLLRTRGAFVATSIAEYFAAQGKNVLLLMDSLTRFCMAQREISLSVGEPPATKGYTPSVFAMLPKLLERAGSFSSGGTITGLYTVLVEGDDMDDPIADHVRSIVDGHIVLSRKLAQKGHFPAIDVLASGSRTMKFLVPADQIRLALKFRDLLATYQEAEDLINIGAYRKGANPKIDLALSKIDLMNQFLKQKSSETCSISETYRQMQELFIDID